MKIGFFCLYGILLLIGCTEKSVTPPPVAPALGYENYVNDGLELSKTGKSQKAIEAYNQATQINPGAPLAWNNLCAEFNKSEKFAEAIENCERAIRLEPRFQLAKNNLAEAEAKFAELKNKLKAEKSTLLKTQDPTSAVVDAGLRFFQARDLDHAEKLWSKVKPTDPLYPLALNNLASSYILRGHFARAERTLIEATKLDPQNQLFKNNQAWLEKKKSESVK